MSHAKKELKRLVRLARQQGHEVHICGSGHLKWYLPGGIVHTAKTPSDTRGLQNIQSYLRRCGLKGVKKKRR